MFSTSFLELVGIILVLISLPIGLAIGYIVFFIHVLKGRKPEKA